MKTILLLRHAKSDWSDPRKTDFDRPLKKRGLEDAPRMGRALALSGCVPDRILSSPAKRAKQTAELVAEACGYHQAIDWHVSFYEGSSDNLIAALQQLPSEVDRAMLVGHNPIMEDTAAELCRGYTEDTMLDTSYMIQMPTAALVCLEASIVDWSSLRPGGAVLQWFLIPKLLKKIQAS